MNYCTGATDIGLYFFHEHEGIMSNLLHQQGENMSGIRINNSDLDGILGCWKNSCGWGAGERIGMVLKLRMKLIVLEIGR